MRSRPDDVLSALAAYPGVGVWALRGECWTDPATPIVSLF